MVSEVVEYSWIKVRRVPDGEVNPTVDPISIEWLTATSSRLQKATGRMCSSPDHRLVDGPFENTSAKMSGSVV